MSDPEDNEVEVDVEHMIAHALNTIDPTGELASENSRKSARYSRTIAGADEFVAGMFHGGHSGQEIMAFGMRVFMLGNLIHMQNCMKSLKFKPPKNPEEDDLWSYH